MAKGIYTKFQEYLKDFSPVSCSIKDANCVYIIYEDDIENSKDNEHGSSIGFYYPKTERVWGASSYGGIIHLKGVVLSDGSYIVVSRSGDVIAQKNKVDDSVKPTFNFEYSIPILKNCPIMRIRHIAGKAYIAANWRTVFRRDGIDNWAVLHGNDPSQVEIQQKQNRELGFNDIGGFSENDIYACGGQGDLWHFNGKKWSELDLPTNIEFKSLCCAPNGKIYIGCENGTLIEGINEQWNILETKAANIDITDMTWYKDKLYLACGMYGLYVFDMDVIKPAPGLSSLGSIATRESNLTDGNKNALKAAGGDEGTIELVDVVNVDSNILAPASLHTLSTDGDILLAAGTDKVASFDGEKWKILYAPYGVNMGGQL